MVGLVTSTGVFVQAGGALLPLPAARTPLGQWMAATVAAIDAGELLPCPHCGKFAGCDCLDWIEWMAAANNRLPLDEMTDEDLPC